MKIITLLCSCILLLFLAGALARALKPVVPAGKPVTFSIIVFAACFSPDGKIFAGGGGSDNVLDLWDVSTGKLLRALPGDYSPQCFSPDGKLIASVGLDNTAILDVSTGKVLRKLPGMAYSLSFCPDGKSLITGGKGGTRLWDISSGKLLWYADSHSDDSYFASYMPNGKVIAVWSGAQIWLYDWVNRRPLHSLYGPDEWVNSVYFSADGKTLASAYRNQTVVLWDIRTGQLLHTLHRPAGTDQMAQVMSSRPMSFSADGKTFASSSMDGMDIWDVASGKLVRTLASVKGPVCFSPDGATFMSGGLGGIKLWDLASGQSIRTFTDDAGQ